MFHRHRIVFFSRWSSIMDSSAPVIWSHAITFLLRCRCRSHFRSRPCVTDRLTDQGRRKPQTPFSRSTADDCTPPPPRIQSLPLLPIGWHYCRGASACDVCIEDRLKQQMIACRKSICMAHWQGCQVLLHFDFVYFDYAVQRQLKRT